ncbi:hypothetical protein Ndes2437A_g02142 [Nannochloris sp. 'desiccata']
MATKLSFSLYPSSEVTGRDLETAFIQYRCSQGLIIDRLLDLGYSVVHLFVTFVLLRSANPRLAVISLSTAIQQITAVILAIRRPKTYAQWRFSFYAFNIIWSMVEGTLLIQDLEISPCMNAGSGIFWLNELLTTSVPWLILHALVYPLPMSLAIVVNGGAATIPLPAAASAAAAIPERRGLLAGVASPAARLGALSSSSVSSVEVSPMISCVTVYALIQIFAFVVTMHALWLSEHAARLDFLSRTDAVDVEWRLERLRKPLRAEQISRFVEIVVTMGLISYILTATVPEILKLLQW